MLKCNTIYLQQFEETSDGGFTFTCQHGLDECVANKWHSCAIHQSKDISQALKFVECLMGKPTAHLEVLSIHNTTVDTKHNGQLDSFNS